MGIGFSHQSVPSLSKTAMRSAGGTNVGAVRRGHSRDEVDDGALGSAVVPRFELTSAWRHSRISIAAASRSRSTYGSPLTSTATRLIVPPVKRYGPLAGVVVGDRLAAVAADAEALAGDHELAGLGLDAALADLLVAVVEREGAGRDAGRVLAVLVEGGRQDQVLAGRHVLGRDDLLLEHADEVVDVVQPVVLDVEGVAAEARAVREEHALRARRRDVDQRADREGAVADVDRLRLGDLGVVREVDVAVARRRELRPLGVSEDLERGAVVERERPVRAGLGEPEVDQLPELLGVLGREVVQLGAVDVGVVELPLVVVEVAPAAERRVGGDGLPAVVPDAAGAEHRVELRLPRVGAAASSKL